ncbi:hypothetical protein [Chryseobacterium sp.]|uniref:hypothetical protein n=1 Tax=Chryseobacterium sp. TaxID=1871047 RepID=UPI002FCB3DA6
MKNILKFILISTLSIGALYGLYVALNLYTGWYGYGYWKYRTGTTTIAESKKRNVFVKELHYKFVEPITIKDFYFKPYIERGYKFGMNNENETHTIKNSKCPYNLSFEWKNNPSVMKDKTKINNSISVFINKDDLNKIDSSDANWGYLGNPYLKDTIRVEYSDYNGNKTGIIKVW